MSGAVQLALSNPFPGMEAEFNEWYGGPHLRHGVETPGILSGQRFRRAPGPWPSGAHDYLMLWELDDPAATLAALAAVKGTDAMPLSPAIDMSTVQPPTFWRRALVRNAAHPVIETGGLHPVVACLYRARGDDDRGFADAMLRGGLADLADRPGVAAAEYLALAEPQIRGNCRKYPHGLLLWLEDEAAALASLGDALATLPHADPERWMAILFQPLDRRVGRAEPAPQGAHA